MRCREMYLGVSLYHCFMILTIQDCATAEVFAWAVFLIVLGVPRGPRGSLGLDDIDLRGEVVLRMKF